MVYFRTRNTSVFLLSILLSHGIGCNSSSKASRDFVSFLNSKPSLDYLARTPFSYHLSATSKGSSLVYTFQGQLCGIEHVAKHQTIKNEQSVWGASQQVLKKIIETSASESEEIFGNNEKYRFILRGDKKENVTLETTVLRGEMTFSYAPIAFPFSIANLGITFRDLLTDSRFEIVDFSQEHHPLHGQSMKLELQYQINGESIGYFVYFDIDSGLPIASGAPSGYYTFQYVEHTTSGKMLPLGSEYWSVTNDSPELVRKTIVLSFEEADEFDDKICTLDYYGFPEPFKSNQESSISNWVFAALGGVVLFAIAAYTKRSTNSE